MGTTCVAAVLQDNFVYVANVGDSRAYLLRDDQTQANNGRSFLGRPANSRRPINGRGGTCTSKNNVIYRCLGTDSNVEIDIFTEQVQEGDLLVLCTDGLTNLISNQELVDIVQQYSPTESVQQLIARANENGGPDNITAIVVQVSLEPSQETVSV